MRRRGLRAERETSAWECSGPSWASLGSVRDSKSNGKPQRKGGNDNDTVRISSCSWFSTRDVGSGRNGAAPRRSGQRRDARSSGWRNGGRERRSGDGRKIGVVTGATRAAVNRETQARAQYEASTDYQNAQHSNFYEAPPEVFGTTAPGAPTKPGVEAVIRKDGKPIVGDHVSFRVEPKDWRQLHLGRQW